VYPRARVGVVGLLIRTKKDDDTLICQITIILLVIVFFATLFRT
jgi:hypothetical protein